MPKKADKKTLFDWDLYSAYALAMLESEPLYRALLNSVALRRLKDVSFLGALELFSQRYQPSDSRFDHTVGVAYLMLRTARELRLPLAQEKHLVAAALLHDVGHGALSHSIEAYFKRRFSVDHKTFTKRIILGDLFIGREVADLLRLHDVDPDSVTDLITGDLDQGFRYLLHGPINVDTIDGIIRASRFFESTWAFKRPDDVLAVLIEPSPWTQHLGDHFWRLKDRIYNAHIYQLEWAVYDSMITRVLSIAQPRVGPDDFLLTDTGFKRKFGSELRDVRGRYEARKAELVFEMSANRELGNRAKQRQFSIDTTAPLGGAADISKRYIEVKFNDVPQA